MKRTAQYIKLRQHFAEAAEGRAMATIDELAAVLDCTHRNVLLILKNMREEGWLSWTPRRGRGHRSALVFLVSEEDMLLEAARELLEKKDLRGALERIGGSQTPAAVRDRFHAFLSGWFGPSSELHGPRTIDLLRFPLPQPYETLDPMQTRYAVEAHLASQLFDPLVRMESPSASPVPHLAHDWERSADGLTWMFYLRKGVLFHDGIEMNADDVVFTLNRLRSLSRRTLYSSIIAAVGEVEALSPNAVRVRLTERNELFLPFLSTVKASIVPKELRGTSPEAFGRRPVGTGPYKLERNDLSMCVMDAYAGYFQGRAHIDRVELWNIPDLYEQAQRDGLAGFQLAQNVPLPKDAGDNESWRKVRQQSVFYKFLTVNTHPNSRLAELLGRRRLLDRLDRGRLTGRIALDAVEPAFGFLSVPPLPTASSASAECGGTAREHEELEDVCGEEYTLCTIPEYEHDALHVQALLREEGIKLKLLLLPLRRFQSEERLQADLLLFAVMLDQDTELRLVDLYTSMLTHIEPQLASQLEQLLGVVRTEPDKTARMELLLRTERLLIDGGVLFVLYRKYLQTAFHPSVTGVKWDAAGWIRFKDLWIKPADDQARDAGGTPTTYYRQS